MSVCVFTTNGTLVTTITDSSTLGPTVAAIGDDKLLIGAPEANSNPDTYDVYGAAYLYSTNGALLMTFNNPNPGMVSGLGYSVAAFGSDRVLISASGEWTGAGLLTFSTPMARC